MPDFALKGMRTWLPGARLVLPTWAEAAETQALLEQLARHGALGLRAVSAEAALAEGYAAGPLVVVGNLNDNLVSRDLYLKRLSYIDAWFPGEDGYAVRRLDVPSVLPHPLLLVGGSSPAGTRQALAVLLDALAQPDWALPPVQTRLLPPPPAPEYVPDMVKKDLIDFLLQSNAFSPSGLLASWAFVYALSGDPGWGVLAREGLLQYAATYAQQVFNGPYLRGQIEFYFGWSLVTAWRLIEADPIFSDADRAAVRGLLQAYAQVTSEATYLEPGANLPGEIRQNHAFSAALSMLEGEAYLRDYMDTARWASALEQARIVVDGQLASYRSNDDGGTDVYAYLNMMDMLHYRTPRGEMEVFETGQVARLADVVLLVSDNRRNEVGYGDSVVYLPWHKQALVRRLYVLGPAAWYTRSGAYQWAYHWLDTSTLPGGATGIQPQPGRIDHTVRRFASDVTPEYPAGYCGVSAALLDDGALRTVDRWYADPGRAGQVPFGTQPVLADVCPLPIDYARWRPQAGRRYFDKLTFRPAFDPEAEYLCVQGTGTFCHGHRDANGIARLTWRDRWWLIDLDYVRASPQHHNVVHVVRDGQGLAYPPLATLERMSEWAGVGVSQTALNDYNGTRWTRTILWRQDHCFLVVDEVAIEAAGDYEVTCLWRTLGDIVQGPQRLDVTQAGVTFSILSAADESEHWRTTARPSRECILDYYPYASPEVQVWHQGQAGARQPGERLRFANLLCAPVDGGVPEAGLQALGQGLYRLEAAGEVAVAGVLVGGLRWGDVEIEAVAVYWTADRLWLSGCTRLVVGAARLQSAVPFDLELRINEGSGTLRLPLEASALPQAAGLVLEQLVEQPANSPVKFAARVGGVSFAPTLGQHLAAAWQAAQQPSPALARPAPVSRIPNVSPAWRRVRPDALTALAHMGDLCVVGDADGHVAAFTPAGALAWEVTLEGPVRALLAIDFHGNGQPQLAVGINPRSVHLLDAQGQVRWQAALVTRSAFGGQTQQIMTLGQWPQAAGTVLLLVGVDPLHVFAVDATGATVLDAAVKYHAVTQVAAGDLDGDGAAELVVGTEYQTPINVLNPDGTRRWYTWEQVGSEHRSTTVRSGVDVRALALADLNDDGRLEIVYGTGDMLVIALDARDGRHLWKADVGGEVVGLAVLGSELVVATDNGRVWRLGGEGARLGYRQVDRALGALAVTATGQLAVGGQRGVWGLAPDLTPLGCLATAAPVTQLRAIPAPGGDTFFYTAGPEVGQVGAAALAVVEEQTT